MPEDVKHDRVDRLMLAQQQIAFEHAEAQVGKTLEILVDGVDDEGRLTGRTAYDAPEIDSRVIIAAWNEEPDVGTLVQARIVAASDYDLVAETLT